MVASIKECLYVDLKKEREIDIDEEHDLQQFKTVMFDNEDKHIYIISNKHGGKLGFYIKKINMMNPFADRGENKGFIVNWNRNLDIGDASIFILRD